DYYCQVWDTYSVFF
nr:immunoglobulin light chain junction region [Macaca mulatta]